jgi:hypothetical protein
MTKSSAAPTLSLTFTSNIAASDSSSPCGFNSKSDVTRSDSVAPSSECSMIETTCASGMAPGEIKSDASFSASAAPRASTMTSVRGFSSVPPPQL